MKGIVQSILIMAISVGSLYAQSHDSITQFNFNTGTRGYSKGIVIRKDSIFIHVLSNFQKVDNRDYKGVTTHKEWDSLMNSIKDLSLSEMQTLKSPTDSRAVDGAWGSSIMITDSSGKNWSHGFDNNDPNEKLKPLMLVIQEIEKKKK